MEDDLHAIPSVVEQATATESVENRIFNVIVDIVCADRWKS